VELTYTEWNAGTPGQPPQQPVPPQSFPPPQGAPLGQPLPGQPEKKSPLKKVLGIAVPVVVVGGLGIARLGLFGAGDPEVGDCIQETGATSFEVVDCGSDEAQYKVVGIEDGEQSYGDFQNDPDSCVRFATAEVALWTGADGELGSVYCAEPL
jgi:hypothetical protein